MKIPTYQDVITEARNCYRESGRPIDLPRAEQILRQGLIDFPYVLPIGDELVLVLEKQNRDDDAMALLEELKGRFRDSSEETHSRFGKLFKKQADRLAEKHPAAAISAFLEAERFYGLAFEKSGAFYARVNQLTAMFLRAAAEQRLDRRADANELVQRVRREASLMLLDPHVWKSRLADDAIWLPATQGEVYLLLADWQKAADAYNEALRAAASQKFYCDCMKSQVQMLLTAHRTLGEIPAGPISDPEVFFASETGDKAG